MAKNILFNLDALDKDVRQNLIWFCENTIDRILYNFKQLHISPYNPNLRNSGDGELMRSIHWTVSNSAGGNKALVSFFYLNYGRYVELATGYELSTHITWNNPGKLPSMQGMESIPRGDDFDRPSKPVISSEIRLQARRLLEKLAKRFAYLGGASIIYNVLDPEKSEAVIQDWESFVKSSLTIRANG